MKISFVKKSAVSIAVASSLFFAACGKEVSAPGAAVIPDSPDAAVRTIISEFARGNGGIIWSALPASYQNDVNNLMHLAGSKADEEVYNKSFSLLGRLANILDQKKSFIVNSSLLNNDPADVSKLETGLPSVVGLINTLTSSGLSSAEGLRNFNGEAFFDTTVSECIGHLNTIGQLNGNPNGLSDYASTVVSVVNMDDRNATLTIAIPGQLQQEVKVTKVENRWVPADMESQWKDNFAKMTASLEATSPEAFQAKKAQVMSALGMVDVVLTQIESAETQEQFDERIKSAVMPLMSIFMLFGQSNKTAE